MENSEQLDVRRKEKVLRSNGRHAHSDFRILFVENDESSQKLTTSLLLRNGMQVDIVASSTAALWALSHSRYNLILMDLILSGVSGLELTSMIRAKEEGRDVWILALTACATPCDRQSCLESGMDAYLSKPFKEKELIEMIRKLQSLMG